MSLLSRDCCAFSFPRGHLFHALRLHPPKRSPRSVRKDLLAIWLSVPHRGDRESPLHSREWIGRATLQRSCKVGSAMPAPRRDAQRRPPASVGFWRDAELQQVGSTRSPQEPPLHRPSTFAASLRAAAPGGRSSGKAQPGPRGRRRPEHLSARAAARSVRSGTSSSAERPPPPGSSSSSSSASPAARFPAEPGGGGRTPALRRRARR